MEKGEVFKGSIAVEGKAVLDVGADLLCPADADILDAEGKDIYPGFVLPLCNIGIRGDEVLRNKDDAEDSQPINPQLDVRHSFDIRDLKIQHMTRLGITSYGLSPGITPLIAGQMSLVGVDGDTIDDVMIAERIAVKGNFTKTVMSVYAESRKMPTTRMGMFYLLDKAFTETREYGEKEDKEFDMKNEALLPVIRGEKPFVVNAETLPDIEAVYELARKHKIRPVFVGAFSIDKCAEKIMEAGYDVILGEFTYMFNYVYSDTDFSKLVDLYRNGLKLSLSTNGDQGYPPAYDQIMWSAAMMRRGGATPDEVIDMMTIMPARALGVDGYVGSISTGKRADLIVCSGNPADKYTNRIGYTIAAGKVYNNASGGEKTCC